VTLAHLPSNVFTFDTYTPLNGKSKIENILIPNFHYVSKPMGDLRWGVSLTAPAGLTKRWDTKLQKYTAEEFTLKNIEINPSIAYKLSENISLGGGIRFIYSEGIVKSDAADLLEGAPISRDMKGDTFEVGYNLALAYKPTSDIEMGVTYRSKIELNEEGTADLSYYETNETSPLYNPLGLGLSTYSGSASVSVPIPAALNIAIAKTFNENFTLEFNYERTYWSAYDKLDFDYNPNPTSPSEVIATTVFGQPLTRNWKDTDTFRVGATYLYNDRLSLMGGFAIDETPVDSIIGFELPDSDAKIYSLGFKYKQNEQLSWGIAALYDDKESRQATFEVNPITHATDTGLFTEGGAFLTTIGVSYKY
jgi:long-chain fatty acid transport protein